MRRACIFNLLPHALTCNCMLKKLCSSAREHLEGSVCFVCRCNAACKLFSKLEQLHLSVSCWFSCTFKLSSEVIVLCLERAVDDGEGGKLALILSHSTRSPDTLHQPSPAGAYHLLCLSRSGDPQHSPQHHSWAEAPSALTNLQAVRSPL